MEFIEIEYNRDLQPLETILSGVKRHGDFFVNGTIEIPMPKVEVDGAGALSFPVPEAQIAALVEQAERAPYGRGENTVIDTSVRKVWQIAPGKIRISGKSWLANFDIILAAVRHGLGCEGVAVSAELYKLLVYDRDGFFLPHRDTEKSDRMFGTLVITLPSAHRGGELRIRHAGREITIDTSDAEFSELSYAAFYADCEHEALPVREGNRVCLIYNLVRTPGKGRLRKLEAPDVEHEIAESATILKRSLHAAGAPVKLVWLLEHQYSPAGLSFSALKSADAARAGVLVQAAARAQCVAHLGIVHIGETGAAEPEYDASYSHGSRWSRYRYDDDDEEGDEHDDEEGDEDGDGDDADGDFTVVTVDDTWRYIDEWRDTNDLAVEFGPIPLAEDELLPEDALDGETPDKQKLMEASGNEGASYERSYHRAAVVLWRRDRYAEVLLQAGVVAGLPYLRQLTAGGKPTRREAVDFAKRMVDAWAGDARRWGGHSHDADRPEALHRSQMLACLTELGAATLLEKFIAAAVIPDYDGSENTALVTAASLLGGAKAATVFSAMVSARMPDHPCECAELLLTMSDDSSRCYPRVAESVVAALDRIGTPDETPVALRWKLDDGRRSLDPQFLENLLRALQRFANGEHCLAAAGKIATHPEAFSPVTIVVPALERIRAAKGSNEAAFDSSIRHLWSSSAEFLLRRSEVPPAPPSDWQLDMKLTCSCPDCRDLQRFALDPVAQIHRFRVKKERRQHLHNAIDKHQFDMTHVTERVGSPQTLVCTKDRRSFDRRMKQYGDEIAAMRTLVRLARGSDSDIELSLRMRKAVKLAAA